MCISSCYMQNMKKQQPLMLKLDDNIKSKYGKFIKVTILQKKKNDMYFMSKKILNYLPLTT